jgi:hypothetical protein
MRSTFRRWAVGVAATATMGVAYQTGCMSFAGDQFLATVDFCFVFDCQNGILGGVFDPCSGTNPRSNPTGSVDDDTVSGNLFIDCPVVDDTAN